MQEIERVKGFLQAHDPSLEVIELGQDSSTSELAAQALGIQVGQIAKSIVFKTKNDDFFMVVSAGDVKIDNKAIKNLVGSRVKMANAEEVQQVTGFNPGGVCPFALSNPIAIYLDESLKRHEIVYTAAGTASSALPISYEDLAQITGGIACRVCL